MKRFLPVTVAFPLVRQADIDSRTAEFALLTVQILRDVLRTVAFFVGRVRTVRLAIAEKQKGYARAIAAIKVGARAVCDFDWTSERLVGRMVINEETNGEIKMIQSRSQTSKIVKRTPANRSAEADLLYG